MNICNSQFSRNIKKDPEGISWAYWLYSSIFFKQNQLNIYSIQLLIVCNLHTCVFSFQIFFQVRCFSFFHGFLLVSRNLFGRYVKGCVFCISSKWIIAMPDNKKRTPSIGISTKREVSLYTPYFWKMLLKNNQYFTCKQISQTVKNP